LYLSARIVLAGGVPLPAVSARLGHSDMQTTLRIYGHMIPGQDDEAVHKWEESPQRNRPASQSTKSVQQNRNLRQPRSTAGWCSPWLNPKSSVFCWWHGDLY
jgi:antibiotic biosynthesis monooxygenase (ABM) superfamily enzyme